MPYPFPQAGLYYQNGNGIVAALYRAAIDPVVDHGAGGIGGDDTLALNAALNACATTGIPLYLPPRLPNGNRTVFGVSSPIDVPQGVSVLGDATALTTGPTIRALSALPYVMGIRGNALFTPNGPQPPMLAGFNIDGAHIAFDGIRFNGAWLARSIERVGVSGVENCAFRACGHLAGVTLSGLSGPSTFTVSLRDPCYNALFGFSTPFALQCVTPGGLGTAAFQLSTNGGTVYNNATQLFASTINLCLTSGFSSLYDTGLQLTWPARTFQVGDTYRFTATPLTESGASDNSTNLNNAEIAIRNCWAYNIGRVYASSALFGAYGSGFADTLLAPGTVSVTSGSQLVVGNSTTFLTGTSLLPGGMFFAVGMTRPLPVACVLDDTHLLLQAGDLPTITAGGLGYALGVGASVWQEDSADNARWEIDRCRFNTNPVGVRTAGGVDGGIGLQSCRLENRLFYDVAVGGLFNSEQGYLLSRVEHKAAIANSFAMYLGPKAAGGTILEPLQDGASLAHIVGPGTAPTVIINGVIGSH